MADFLIVFLQDSQRALLGALVRLFPIAVFFLSLGLLVKGRAVLGDMRRAALQSGLNLQIMVFNLILTAPILTLTTQALIRVLQSLGMPLIGREFWSGLPPLLVTCAAVFLGDFVSYWRHRLEHTHMFWPSHAVHHSDTKMTWLTRERFHPVDHIIFLIFDGGVLLLIGFPSEAIVLNLLVRTYYGYLVHADLPWTYGWLGRVFVSPAMHRWHHAADSAAFNTNFAGLFSVFDLVFGTFRVPGPCNAPLGVTDGAAPTLTSQLGYAFSSRAYNRPEKMAKDAYAPETGRKSV